MSDRAMEHLLRGLQGPPEGGHYGRQDGRHPIDGDCPDAETLAALADDTLASAVRRDVETHVADCHRCQMLMAAMARAERVTGAAPAEAASDVRTWKRRAFNWLVPAAAAATAVALWVIVPGQRTPLPEQPELDRRTAEAEAVAGAPSGAPTNERLREEPETRQGAFAPESADALADSARRAPARPAELRRTSPSAPPPAPVSEPALKAEQSLSIEPQTNAPPAAAPQAAAQTPESPAAGSRPPSREAPADRGQASGAAARNDSDPSESAAPTQEQVRIDDTARLRTAQAPAAAVGARVAVAFEVVSPNSQARWRVVTGSIVQRSVDGGVTWTAQQTGAATELTGGNAPSSDVCWLVGRGGTVLRTMDGGRQWQRTTIPATADLTTVTAPTALNAIVTGADGRRFETTDGGRTWARVP